MSLVTVTNLSKSHGAQVLFEDASLQLHAGYRYGIVGANGSGKSTLLRIIGGVEEASGGEVQIPRKARVGLLRQDHFKYEHVPILDVVMMGRPEIWEAMVEKEKLLAAAEEEFDGERYADLEAIVLEHDGYTVEAQAAEILEGLNIPADKHRDPLSSLSGGFKLRVLMAQVLASDPDVLLLDEPTNHLDILSIRWLEKFLSSFRGCVALVSHDRRFLNQVCTHVIDVDYQRVMLYRGDYDAFLRAKVEERARREAEIDKRRQEIADHKAFVERFKSKPTKARQANSKAKRIKKIVIEELPRSSRQHPHFRFKAKRPSGKDVAFVRHVSKSFGDNRVLNDVSLQIRRGDRLAIIGPNGIGKSTLLKILMGELSSDEGSSEWGYEAHPGYFSQDHKALRADESATIMSWLWDLAPEQSVGFVRGRLAEVLFDKDEVNKKVKHLSGGESARLVFAGLGVTQPTVLVLDEPTNHLDLEGIEALAEHLKAYDGTLIFVSHNRWFVNALATRILELKPEGFEDFSGDYQDYLRHCGDDHLDVDAVVERARRRS